MIILAGTTSEPKLAYVREVFPDANIVSLSAASEVTDQPLDLDTTCAGATNRARNAIAAYGREGWDYALGLEGGLVERDGLYGLVCVVVRQDKSGAGLAAVSGVMPLPKAVSDAVKSGEQFGQAICQYRASLPKNAHTEIERADDLISRRLLFVEALKAILPDARW